MRGFQQEVWLVILIVLVLLMAGCIGPGAICRISVANASRQDISSVVVRDDAGSRYVFENLAAHAAGVEQPVETGVAQNITLEITARDGSATTKAVDLGRPVPHTFAGDLLLQIEDGGNVRVFFLQDSDAGQTGDLPWATPPAWQGVVNVPGLAPPE
jgi:hypothetical protein